MRNHQYIKAFCFFNFSLNLKLFWKKKNKPILKINMAVTFRKNTNLGPRPEFSNSPHIKP